MELPKKGPRSSDLGSTIGVSEFYQQIKFRAFGLVLKSLELKNTSAEKMSRGLLHDEINKAADLATATEGVALNSAERRQLLKDVNDEICGLGPLEPLLKDPNVDDIVVNGPFSIYVEREGILSRVPTRFRDSEHLMNIIHRIVGPIGRRVDETTPFVDARLPDGSRVNVIIPPIALNGPMVSIRKFKRHPLTAKSLVELGAISREMMDYLARVVGSRLNVLIVGSTGSGKTTLLNVLSGFIGERERLITIEDAAELQLHQPHVGRLETRPATPEGVGEISARDLVRNALRMRPDRIILGEVRGGEAVDMLQAMGTGHDGSMGTIHANSTRDALSRLEMLLAMGGLVTDTHTLRRYIAGCIQVIVQVSRLVQGARRVVGIVELVGLEGGAYAFNEMFRFEESPPMSGNGRFVQVAAGSAFEHRLSSAAQFATGKDEGP
jgi:pilus assembly protein CpaF